MSVTIYFSVVFMSLTCVYSVNRIVFGFNTVFNMIDVNKDSVCYI